MHQPGHLSVSSRELSRRPSGTYLADLATCDFYFYFNAASLKGATWPLVNSLDVANGHVSQTLENKSEQNGYVSW